MARGTESFTLTSEVKRLVQRSRFERDAGAKICALGDDAIAILCTLVQAEARRKDLAFRIAGTIWIIYAVFHLILVATVPQGSRHFPEDIASLIVFVTMLGANVLVRSGKRATDLLTSLDDVRAVGPLLDAIPAYSLQPFIRATIRKSLTPLLTRLQASDAARLLPRHIAMLNAELEKCGVSRNEAKIRYTVVVLKALEQVGDETSLRCIERVLPKVENTRIHEAAEECLLYLQSRGTLGKHMLLRAASAGSGNLLRASQSSEACDPNVLLRPTASSE